MSLVGEVFGDLHTKVSKKKCGRCKRHVQLYNAGAEGVLCRRCLIVREARYERFRDELSELEIQTLRDEVKELDPLEHNKWECCDCGQEIKLPAPEKPRYTCFCMGIYKNVEQEE